MNPLEITIIEIGAEGGSITVVMRPGESGIAEYAVRLRDQSLTFLPGEETGQEIRRDSVWTDRWAEAIAALGRWPWPMLYPLYIHPDYADRVLAAIIEYRGRDGRAADEGYIEKWTTAVQKTREWSGNASKLST